MGMFWSWVALGVVVFILVRTFFGKDRWTRV